MVKTNTGLGSDLSAAGVERVAVSFRAAGQRDFVEPDVLGPIRWLPRDGAARPQ